MIEVFLPFSRPSSSLSVPLQFPFSSSPVPFQFLFGSPPVPPPSRPRSRRFHRLSPEHKSFKKGHNSLKLSILPPRIW